MPTYEFLCTDCGAGTDVRSSIAELEAGLSVACATCGSASTRRALSTFAVRGRASAAATASAASAASAPSGGCAGGCACGPG